MVCFDIPEILQHFISAAGSRKEGGDTLVGEPAPGGEGRKSFCKSNRQG